MIRRLLNILMLLSLVLCAAMVALWVRSYFVRDQLRAPSVQINTDAGFVGCTVFDDETVELADWTSGTDPAYFPAGALPDPQAPQRYESLERTWWEPRSDRQYPVIRVQTGRLSTMEFARRDDPDSPDWEVVRDRWRAPPGYVAYRLPFWALALPTGVLPAAFVVAALVRMARARARAARGLCRGCGYDLRGTPGRCPECGERPVGAGS